MIERKSEYQRRVSPIVRIGGRPNENQEDGRSDSRKDHSSAWSFALKSKEYTTQPKDDR